MTDQPEARRSARVDKPWGHEEIFAQVEGSYVGKTLHVNGGESLSLQWHHEKDETIAVLSGQVEIDLGTERGHAASGHRGAGRVGAHPARPAAPGARPHRLRPRRGIHGRPRVAGGRRPPRRPLRPPRHPSTLNTPLGRNPHERTSHPRRPGQPRPSPWSASRPDTRTPAVAADDAPPALTNLAHLDWLGDTVDPPDEDEPLHTTYRLAEEPEIGVLWTYAEPRNGVLTRVGGGNVRPRRPTPTARAPSTPTTSRAPRSSTSGTGSRPARRAAATRRTRCCAA